MEKLEPCAECTKLQNILGSSFQVNPRNDNDDMPPHSLVFFCSNGDMFHGVLIQRSSEELVNAIKEVEAAQVKITEALSDLCSKLKDTSELQFKNMALSKSCSQESLTSSRGYKPITARPRSQQCQAFSPGRSLDSLTNTPSQKYGISASLSKLKANQTQNTDLCRPAKPKF